MNKTTKVSAIKTSKLNEAWGKTMESADLDILKNIETVDFRKITSEPGVVVATKVSGMLKDFFKESQLVDDLSGREASVVFDFKISG